jgi:hypothetical protein
MTDRPSEEAAIAAHIAQHGITRLPPVDPVARALELWSTERQDKPRGHHGDAMRGAISRAHRKRKVRNG